MRHSIARSLAIVAVATVAISIAGCTKAPEAGGTGGEAAAGADTVKIALVSG